MEGLLSDWIVIVVILCSCKVDDVSHICRTVPTSKGDGIGWMPSEVRVRDEGDHLQTRRRGPKTNLEWWWWWWMAIGVIKIEHFWVWGPELMGHAVLGRQQMSRRIHQQNLSRRVVALLLFFQETSMYILTKGRVRVESDEDRVSIWSSGEDLTKVLHDPMNPRSSCRCAASFPEDHKLDLFINICGTLW